MAITIRRDNDPFKKYWWVILVGVGLVGCWVCLPLMEAGTGSGSVSKEGGLSSAEQSLDSANNPSGAPGSAVNLSMEGSYRKKMDGPITSSLYQPPPEPEAAPEAPKPAEAKGSLADALKNVAKKSASAAKDPTGWGGAKAQKGFTAPKVNLGGMSGLGGGASGSGASASGGGASAGGGRGLSAFGAETAKTGTAFARGLRPEAPDSKGGSKSMKVLEAARAASVAAAQQRSNDAAAFMGGTSFDGRGGGGGSGIGGPGGASAGGGGGVYGSMDAAPVNLKVNNPNLDSMKITAPPADKKEEKDPNDEMRKKIMEMLITGLIGGLVGGVVSGVLGAAGLDGGGKGKKDGGDDESSLPRVSDLMYAVHSRRPYGFPAA